MTMRNRQLLVAAGLVILAAWFLFTLDRIVGADTRADPGAVADRRDRVRTAHVRTERRRGLRLTERAVATAGRDRRDLAGREREPGRDAGAWRHGAPGRGGPLVGDMDEHEPGQRHRVARDRLDAARIHPAGSPRHGRCCLLHGRRHRRAPIDGDEVAFEVVARDEVVVRGHDRG